MGLSSVGQTEMCSLAWEPNRKMTYPTVLDQFDQIEEDLDRRCSMRRIFLFFMAMVVIGSLVSCELLTKGQRTNSLTRTLSSSTGPVNPPVDLTAGGSGVSQFQWSIDSRPASDSSVIVSPNSQSTSFTPLSAGHYLIRVTAVQDGIMGTVFVSKPFDAY